MLAATVRETPVEKLSQIVHILQDVRPWIRRNHQALRPTDGKKAPVLLITGSRSGFAVPERATLHYARLRTPVTG